MGHSHGPYVGRQSHAGYVERRVAEGRAKLEVIRVLKRYVARELYRYLMGIWDRERLV